MIMIGLEIVKNNESDNFLYNFFNGIDLKKYNWVIDYEEILFDEERDFFNKKKLNGQEFFKCITRNNYYIIFMDLKVYKVENRRIENENIKIETYNDYLKSDCEMIFLCSDSQFIDFYCKDKEILRIIYKNCFNSKLNVLEITEANNRRTKMSVF